VGNEQVDNKNTTQTQQHGKWTQYKLVVAKKCLQKLKNQKSKQQAKNEQV
jgi:hypothetical protein